MPLSPFPLLPFICGTCNRTCWWCGGGGGGGVVIVVWWCGGVGLCVVW